jgi:hypothetical protein
VDLQHGAAAGVLDDRGAAHLHHAVDDSHVDLWKAVPVADGADAVLQGDAGALSIDVELARLRPCLIRKEGRAIVGRAGVGTSIRCERE